MTREEAIEVIEQDIPCEHDRDLIEAWKWLYLLYPKMQDSTYTDIG